METSLVKLSLVGYIIHAQPKSCKKQIECYISESTGPLGILVVVYHRPREAQFFRTKSECNKRIRPLKKFNKDYIFTIVPIGALK